MPEKNRKEPAADSPRLSAPLAGVRAVLFDLDGTLVDAFADITAAVNHGLRSLGLPERSIEEVRPLVGDGLHALAARCLGERKADLAPRVVELLIEYYREHPADFAHIYPGGVEVLRALRRHGIRTAILSNKRHEITMRVLDRLGLAPLIDTVAGEGGDLGKKPDPRGYREVLRRLSLEARESVMVGDGEPDAQVARNVGARFLGVSYGLLPRARLMELGAVAVIDNLGELPALLGLRD